MTMIVALETGSGAKVRIEKPEGGKLTFEFNAELSNNLKCRKILRSVDCHHHAITMRHIVPAVEMILGSLDPESAFDGVSRQNWKVERSDQVHRTSQASNHTVAAIVPVDNAQSVKIGVTMLSGQETYMKVNSKDCVILENAVEEFDLKLSQHQLLYDCQPVPCDAQIIDVGIQDSESLTVVSLPDLPTFCAQSVSVGNLEVNDEACCYDFFRCLCGNDDGEICFTWQCPFQRH